MNVKNKVALVTGGNSGIGRSTAHAFAREGAKVVIALRNVERGDEVVNEIRQAGSEAIFVPTDVAEAKQIAALIATTVARYGRRADGIALFGGKGRNSGPIEVGGDGVRKARNQGECPRRRRI